MDVAEPSYSVDADPMSSTSYLHDPSPSANNYDQLASVCGGCKRTIDEETGGVVVAFGYVPSLPCFRLPAFGGFVSWF